MPKGVPVVGKVSGRRIAMHGTVNEYVNHDCRCEPCRQAHTIHSRLVKRNRVARGICQECGSRVGPLSLNRCDKHFFAARARQRKMKRAKS